VEQARELLAAGCRLGQGYGILPPVPEARLLQWLRQPSQAMAALHDAPEAGPAADTSDRSGLRQEPGHGRRGLTPAGRV
jgi:hypothetical protein